MIRLSRLTSRDNRIFTRDGITKSSHFSFLRKKFPRGTVLCYTIKCEITQRRNCIMRLLVIDGNSIANRAFYGIKLLTTKDGR